MGGRSKKKDWIVNRAHHILLHILQPENVSCFFHTIYKEKHNIIMEGDENIHETPEQCETSCYVITHCKFWKFSHSTGFCELSSGTPLDHGEVMGQKDVKLIETQGKEPICEFPVHHHPPH